MAGLLQEVTLSWIAILMCAGAALGEVKPAALFSDHMVLQSGMPPVWGTANPGEAVTVEIQGQKRSVTAGMDGEWLVRLMDLKPGGPLEMTVTGTNAIVIHDVLVGEVWLGSGQSNMDLHPHNKEPLGDRLTRIALANAHHQDIEFSGPV